MPQPQILPFQESATEDELFFCSFHYRQAIVDASPEQMRELALTLLDELEDHRQVFREYGISPPLRHDPKETCAIILRRRPLDRAGPVL